MTHSGNAPPNACARRSLLRSLLLQLAKRRVSMIKFYAGSGNLSRKEQQGIKQLYFCGHVEHVENT